MPVDCAESDSIAGGPEETRSAPPVRVSVVDEQEQLEVSSDEVRDLATFVLDQEGSAAGVEIALVDDATIAGLHERFLGQTGPTDVLSFPMEDEEGDSLGEVVVSTETAIRQGREYSEEPIREVLLYIVHGILHLLGHDDHEEAARETMDHRQREILERWWGNVRKP